MERSLVSVWKQAAGVIASLSIFAALSQPSFAQPLITSVSRISAQSFQTIVVSGSGFGTHSAYSGDSNFIAFNDVSKSWQAGYNGNATGLIVESWTDSQIVLGGFDVVCCGGSLGLGSSNAGDTVNINVWNAQSGSGPASIVTSVNTAALLVATAGLPNATVAQSYNQSLTASGGSGSGYTWFVFSGPLPPGFSLSTSGALSAAGSAVTQSGAYAFTVQVTDSTGDVARQTLTLNILRPGAQLVQIVTADLPNAISGQSYSATLQAAGGTSGYTWSVLSGALPSGFSLSSSGAITSTGSPTVSANQYNFTVQVTDSGGDPATQTLALAVVQANVPQITSVSQIFAQSFQTIVISGSGFGTYNSYNGDSNYIAFNDVSKSWQAGYNGNATGLMVESWTDSQIVLGGFDVVCCGGGLGLGSGNAGDTVAIDVWNAPSGNGPSIVVSTVAASSLQITTSSLPNATIGQAYGQALTASGGSGSGYKWIVYSGPLPFGFTLSTAGVLSATGNTAAQAGTYVFAVQVTDSAGAIARQAFALNILPSQAQPLQVLTTSLPNATTGQSYSATLQATGGAGSGYAWSLLYGTLPSGFTLSSAGVLTYSGTPAAAGNQYNVTVQVTDSAGDLGTQALELVVVQPSSPQITSVNQILAQSSQTMVISGSGFGTHNAYNGDSNYIAFNDVSKSWQAGYNGNATGLIVESWTDSQIVLGGFNVVCCGGSLGLASGSAGETVEIDVWNGTSGNGPSALITTVAASPVQVTSVLVPNATSTQAYSTTLTASGGTGAGYTWCVYAGALPFGFSLSASGVLTSTGAFLAQAGSYSFTVQVTDSGGNLARLPLALPWFSSQPRP